MARRTLAFLGDCQAGALAQIYRDFVAPLNGDVVHFVDAGHESEENTSRLAQADVVVAQVFSIERKITLAGARRSAMIVEFPAIFAGFLWPYSGLSAHPRNAPAPGMATGPYPRQLGDKFLNGLIEQGIPADEALRRYLDLDIARVAYLDRLMELHLGAQSSRDARTGFEFSRAIASRFRDVQLFLTSSQPTLEFMTSLIRGVFKRLGIPATTIDLVLQSQRVAPFSDRALPIHPGIIRHFGLRFANDNTRYPFGPEGSYTFAEFVIRYVNYTWNRDLAEGMALAGTGNLELAHSALQRGLVISPESAAAWRSMSVVLRRMRRFNEARAAAERAVVLARSDPMNHIELARLHLHAGDIVRAEAVAREAIAVFPYEGRSHRLLASVLLTAGRLQEAEAFARRAVTLRPADEESRHLLDRIVGRLGTEFGNVARVATPTASKPLAQRGRLSSAQALFREGHLEEAYNAVQNIIAADASNSHAYALLGHISARKQDAAAAEAAFRKASEIDPSVTGFRISLAHALAAQKKFGQALALLHAMEGTGNRDIRIQIALRNLFAKLGGTEIPKDASGKSMPPVFPAEFQPFLSASELASAVAIKTGLSIESLAMQFDSLGDDCEFGVFQRKCGAEPLGLFRFSNPRPDVVLRLIATDFEGLGEGLRARLNAGSPRREWMLIDPKYSLREHTFVWENDDTQENLERKHRKRVALLRRLMLENISAGNKIFVIKSGEGSLSFETVAPIARALLKKGPNWLLWVERGIQVGHVQIIGDGLMRGTIDRLCVQPNVGRSSFAGWLAVLSEAIRVVRRHGSHGPIDATTRKPDATRRATSIASEIYSN